MSEQTIYEVAGGAAPFRRLVEGFYARVEQEPLLRPMYPTEDLTPSKEWLFMFLIQYFGGPRHYAQQRGAPMLRMRHMPFAIGQAERDAWVKHMLAALEEADFPAEVHAPIRAYFEHAATFMINRQEPGNLELTGR